MTTTLIFNDSRRFRVYVAIYRLNSEPFAVLLKSLYFRTFWSGTKLKIAMTSHSTWWHYIFIFVVKPSHYVHGLQMRQTVQNIYISFYSEMQFIQHPLPPFCIMKSSIHATKVPNMLAYTNFMFRVVYSL